MFKNLYHLKINIKNPMKAIHRILVFLPTLKLNMLHLLALLLKDSVVFTAVGCDFTSQLLC
jgi:hypothetical protein